MAMDSEYKVGAVADIIARLSQKQNPDSTSTENESTPMKKKGGKKRKLDFSNPGDIKENGTNNKNAIKTKKKKVKTVNVTDNSNLGQETISKKKTKIQTNETKSKNKPLKKTKKQPSQNEVNKSSDLKLNKGTPPSKDLVNGSEKQSEKPTLNEKQNTGKKAKQLKKKIKAKQNEKKKNKSNNVAKQDSEENKQLETQETPKKATGKKGKKKKTSSEPPSTTQSETVKEIPQNAEKETISAQKGTNGFPKHVGNSAEEQSEEPKLNEEQESRTVFVGNLPLKIPRDKVTNMFKQYGEVETVRFRSVPVGDISLPRNACIKMNKIHEKRTNMNAYVRFKNIESVEKALEMNGTVVNEHTIRVDTALKKTKTNSHSIFIGNLAFEAEEEEVRKAFESCGEIDNVRIIRDQQTNTGKGFGYVNFKSADGVAFAMEMENVKIRNREVRVKRSFDKKSSKSGGQFNAVGPRFANSKPDRFGGRFDKSQNNRVGGGSGGGNFRGNKPNFRADKGVTENRKEWGGSNRNNDAAGFKNRDNRFNKKETSAGFSKRENSAGGFKKKFDKDKTSFQGSTVHEKGNKKNQKKKLSYDALKKFIIAKKLTSGGGEKKKGFNFLTK